MPNSSLFAFLRQGFLGWWRISYRGFLWALGEMEEDILQGRVGVQHQRAKGEEQPAWCLQRAWPSGIRGFLGCCLYLLAQRPGTSWMDGLGPRVFLGRSIRTNRICAK